MTDQLREEVREPAAYAEVLDALAEGGHGGFAAGIPGALRLADLARATGRRTSVLLHTLATLIATGRVVKETPFCVHDIGAAVGARNASARAVYRIADPLTHFTFRHLRSATSLVGTDAPETVWAAQEEDLRCGGDVWEAAFREVCAAYLRRGVDASASGDSMNGIGRWWGRDPDARRGREERSGRKSRTVGTIRIDLMADESETVAWFGTCVGSEAPVGEDVLRTLHARTRRIFRCDVRHLFAFSRSGFTPECEALARTIPNVRLVTLAQMCEAVRKSSE